MRKLSELIVLIRGGGEVGSAIAHRLYRSHFRICITEEPNPLAINRGVCFSEAVYESPKSIEGVSAEKANPNLEQIYKVWRNDKIPVVVDSDSVVKPLIKPDVLINAMMLKRETNTRITDAPLVIGIGQGFVTGVNVHLVVESNYGINLGKVIIEGEAEKPVDNADSQSSPVPQTLVKAEDAGLFTTNRNIGDSVQSGDIIGLLNDVPLNSPISGVLCGLMRSETKVLGNTDLAEIDPVNNKAACFTIRGKMRAIAGGALEAVMMSFNQEDLS